mgnify:CR=1 FL=1
MRWWGLPPVVVPPVPVPPVVVTVTVTVAVTVRVPQPLAVPGWVFLPSDAHVQGLPVKLVAIHSYTHPHKQVKQSVHADRLRCSTHAEELKKGHAWYLMSMLQSMASNCGWCLVCTAADVDRHSCAQQQSR